MPTKENGNRNMHGYFALRWKILLRDNFTCRYCGQHAPDVKLEVDHINPIEDGGDDNEDNLTTSCYACNRGKSALRIMVKRRLTTRPITTPVTVGGDNTGTLIEKIRSIALSSSTPINTTRVAADLNSTPNTIRVMMHRLRKRKLIPESLKHKGGRL